MKTINVSESFDFARERERFPHVFAFLLDAPVREGGGTGTTFDWIRFPRDQECKVFLAGGLNPENVADAIRETRPWAVDVASGIEAEDRSKSRTRMVNFMQEVRSVRS